MNPAPVAGTSPVVGTHPLAIRGTMARARIRTGARDNDTSGETSPERGFAVRAERKELRSRDNRPDLPAFPASKVTTVCSAVDRPMLDQVEPVAPSAHVEVGVARRRSSGRAASAKGGVCAFPTTARSLLLSTGRPLVRARFRTTFLPITYSPCRTLWSGAGFRGTAHPPPPRERPVFPIDEAVAKPAQSRCWPNLSTRCPIRTSTSIQSGYRNGRFAVRPFSKQRSSRHGWADLVA